MDIGPDSSAGHRLAAAARDEVDVFDRSANERRLLALLQRSGALPGVEVARRLKLSAQAVSVMMRNLEADGLIARDEAIRGKVGKPQTPFRLAAEGVYSVGLRIGRRSTDIVLVDFAGRVLGHGRRDYAYPEPGAIDHFARTMTRDLTERLPSERRSRIAGIGIGAPFELWNWLDDTSAPKARMDAWRAFSFEEAFSEWTDLDILVGNDASLACQGEAMFGAARGLPDFGYFYVGSFIGGGVYLGGRLFTGATGNAAAFGSLPVRDAAGAWGQLLEFASIHQLELALETGSAEQPLAITSDAQWEGIEDALARWIADTADQVAHACMGVVAAFDVPVIVIDGSFPGAVRDRLIAAVETELSGIDRRGTRLPDIVAGTLGSKASALGAAYEPIIDRLLE